MISQSEGAKNTIHCFSSILNPNHLVLFWLWFRIENSNIACSKEVDRPLASQRRNEVALLKFKANVLSGLFSSKIGEY